MVPVPFTNQFNLAGVGLPQVQTVFQSLVGPLCWSLHHDDLHMVFRLHVATIASRLSHAKREGTKLAPVIILLGNSKQRESISLELDPNMRTNVWNMLTNILPSDQ